MIAMMLLKNTQKKTVVRNGTQFIPSGPITGMTI
jgi:hypothetical protein